MLMVSMQVFVAAFGWVCHVLDASVLSPVHETDAPWGCFRNCTVIPESACAVLRHFR